MVAQAVSTPEIGRAIRPIRIQLMVLGDDEDDDIMFVKSLPPLFFVARRNEMKFRIQNQSMHLYLGYSTLPFPQRV